MTLTVSMKATAIGITNEEAGPLCWGSGAFIVIGGVGEPEGGVWYSEGALPEELEAMLLREGVRNICMMSEKGVLNHVTHIYA